MSASKPALESLTGLRGLAAFYVVLYHIRSSLEPSLSEGIIGVLAKGYLAVDLFFVLSGFVMWLSYADKFAKKGFAAAPDFLWRRIARIYPLHLAILGAMCGFAIVLLLTKRTLGPDMSFAELPLHILLIQNWGLVDSLHWNDPAWSISAEFAAYLIFPAIALGLNWNRRSLFVLVISIITILISLAASFRYMNFISLGGGISQMGVIRCIGEFTVGTALASMWQRDLGPKQPVIPLAASLFIITAGIYFDAPQPLFIPMALSCFIFFVVVSDRKLSWLSRGPIHYLGKISYSIYLSHVFVFTLFKLFFVQDVANIGLLKAFFFILSMLTISALLHKYLEVPAQRYINSKKPASIGGFTKYIMQRRKRIN